MIVWGRGDVVLPDSVVMRSRVRHPGSAPYAGLFQLNVASRIQRLISTRSTQLFMSPEQMATAIAPANQ
jgi:hypothetical protein